MAKRLGARRGIARTFFWVYVIIITVTLTLRFRLRYRRSGPGPGRYVRFRFKLRYNLKYTELRSGREARGFWALAVTSQFRTIV